MGQAMEILGKSIGHMLHRRQSWKRKYEKETIGYGGSKWATKRREGEAGAAPEEWAVVLPI